MSSRLASLTPSKGRPDSRGSFSPSPSPGPTTPLVTETTHHRMLKIVLTEVKSTIKTWDELVIVDGFKAGKGCVDESTEMDNLLQTPEVPERPHLSPHLSNLRASRSALQTVIMKLEKYLNKLSILVDQAEKIFFEACKLQSWDFTLTEPLWLTWTLERFVDSLTPLLYLHNQHLTTLKILSQHLQSPSTSFDDAKLTLERWRDISIGGERYEAVREWEELVELELAGYGGDEEDDDVEGMKLQKKKGKR